MNTSTSLAASTVSGLATSVSEDLVLDEAQLAQMKTLGYLSINEITSQKEVSEVRKVLEKLFKINAGFEEGANFNFAGNDEDPNAPSAPQIIGPHNYATSLRKTEFYRKASIMACQILGPEARFSSDHTLCKPALNGPATPWHQDESFRDPSYDYNELSVWMPLQAVDQTNGCMEFIPGTHLQEVLPHRSPNNDPKIHALECYEGFNPSDAVPCRLPAGGCTIHMGRTLHASGPNRSDKPRLAYVLIFSTPPVPATTSRDFFWLKQKDTARMRRMKTWLKKGGFLVESWRVIKDTDGDLRKVIPQFRRKAHLLFCLLLSRKPNKTAAPNEPAST